MSEHLFTLLAGGFFTTWFFALGACFGSFLNVVVWRMPRNIPVAAGGSFCPKCKTPILFQDNVPIFGWIKLKGKCRACGLPISSRYPIVETITAVLFMTFFLLEVIAHGINLPPWFDSHHGGWLAELPSCELLFVYIRHITLLYFLLGIALIDYDQQKVPPRLTTFVVLLSLAYTLLMPASLPMPLVPGQSPLPEDAPYLTSLTHWSLNAALSLAASLVIPATCYFASLTQRFLIAQMLLLIGCYLGWQVTLALSIPAFLVLATHLKKPTLPTGLTFFSLTTLFLLTWRLLSLAHLNLSNLSLPQTYIIIALLTLLATILSFFTNPTQLPNENSPDKREV